MIEKEHVIVGTAGHIDHGKSALVRALTGTDPDTLPEEKERGMTIELGFVFLDDPDYEKQIVFIDVPGHEKFVKTMAAGASNVDAALFIIAADEGISVQTREHFDILQLMGINLGAIALTKSDLVDETRIAELTGSVRDFVRGSFLENAPILPVSALTGEGVPEIKTVLQDLGRRTIKRTDSGIFRMPIDRVFTMRGFGTVIAGTVLGGEIRAGDKIVVYPDGMESRVRGIQVHGARKDFSRIGKRTALNLQDIKKEDLRRGQVAAAAGSLVPTIRLDAQLNVLRSAAKGLKHRDRVRLHVGTDEVIARLVLLEETKIEPGGEALVQFVLERPAATLPDDRFAVRSFSPLLTIAGGVILDAVPGKHKRFNEQTIEALKKLSGTTRDSVEQLLRQSSQAPMSVQDIARKLGKSETEVDAAVQELQKDDRLITVVQEKPKKFHHRAVYDALSAKADSFISEYFEQNQQNLLMPYADLRARFLKLGDAQTLKLIADDLSRTGKIFRKDAQIGLVGREASFKPAEQQAAQDVERLFRNAGFASPLEEDVRQKLGLNPNLFKTIIRNLIQDGQLVRLGKKVLYHRNTYTEVREIVVGYLERRGSITIAELRDRLKLSRKYAQAVLEHFNETGLTRRVEDRHVLARKTGRQ